MGRLLSEVGGFRKSRAKLRIALVYPNEYAVGMASLGLHTVYSILNGYDEVACERLFLGMDRTMESNSPLSAFDVLAFSFQYELDYVKALEVLVKGGIEPRREQRRGPLLIAGGPCCYNPMPLTDFFDLFVVGEIEPVADDPVVEWCNLSGNCKAINRRRINYAYVSYTRKRQMQGPRYGRGGERHTINGGTQFFDTLLVGNSETLFFINY